MADNDQLSWKLDLDAQDFIKSAASAKKSIDSISDVTNLTELMSKLGEVGLAVGILGTAFLALKAGLDGVFTGEDINATAAQFDLLTQKAGVYNEDLKKGLIESAQGWAGENEIMQAANKALTELQVGADKLPAIMNLARQAAATFGGTLIQNFEAINQAVATGTTRQLRHLGIVVDQQVAYQNYAKSVGITVDAMGQAEKQQAILNAVLEKGSTDLQSMSGNLKPAQSAWASFKSAMSDVGDTIAVVWNKIAGPTVTAMFQSLANTAKEAKAWITDTFGSGVDQARAHTEMLTIGIQKMQLQLDQIAARKAQGAAFVQPNDVILAQQLNAQIAQYNAQLATSTNSVKSLSNEDQKREAAATQAAQIKQQQDAALQQRMATERAKAQKDLEALRATEVEGEMHTMTTIEQARQLYDQKRIADAQKVQAQIQAIDAEQAKGGITGPQADQQRAELHKIYNQKMQQDDEQLRKYQEQALTQYVQKSDSAFSGIGRAFAATAQKSKLEMQNFGQVGTNAVQSFSSHATSSIQQWGAGTKTATQAIAGTFGGMAGDMASQYGELMMLASIWPPNPAAFAAGVALVALGGYLGSLGGGTPSSASASAPSTSDTSASTAVASTPASSSAAAVPSKNNVNLIIQGDMVTNEQTAQWITQQVRAAADQTDFKVQSVGGGL